LKFFRNSMSGADYDIQALVHLDTNVTLNPLDKLTIFAMRTMVADWHAECDDSNFLLRAVTGRWRFHRKKIEKKSKKNRKKNSERNTPPLPILNFFLIKKFFLQDILLELLGLL
jgi:hypothetical protein